MSIQGSRFLLLALITGLATLAPLAALEPQQPAPLPPSLVPPASLPPSAGSQGSPQKQAAEEKVSIQFPHTSVSEVLTIYEKLTGKRLIRDSNLQGPELSILVADPVPKGEAISLIESSLLLNGYTIIPVDAKTVKILGPSRPPRAEGLPLYLQESELPADGDKLVSFYKPLRFLAPSEAIPILQGVVQLNAFGSLVAVPNTGAIVITDKTPIIRKALALLEVIDKEPNQIITEFIPLQRASAEKVVETLGSMFGGGSGGGGGGGGGNPGQPQQGGGATVVSGGGGETHLLTGKAQFLADKRTNRVLIVVKAENYKRVRSIIEELDQPVEAAQPLVRPLNYISEADLFPVLVDMLKGKEDSDKDSSGASKSQATPAPTPQQNASGSSGTSSGSAANTPDKLSDAAAFAPPQSATIGSTSILGDASGNAIIVYGPPEAKAKASQIIDLLDQRPKQVYLAAVIGQLQLDQGMDYGANWFAKIGTSGTNNLFASALTPNLNSIANAGITGLATNAAGLLNNAYGMNIFGYVAKNVLTYAHFLETTGKFRILSRPVVYTSNNKKATIFNGQNVPIPGTSTYNTVGAVGTNSLNNVTSTVQYQPVVLKLEVIPLINSDKEVNLVIAQKNDTIGSTNNVGGNEVPVINTQELTTTVRVPNGSTIVLGGLIQEEKTGVDEGVPYISKIPVLGPLLGGHDAKNRTRKELVIMIQPIVVDSNEKMEEASSIEGGDSDLGTKSRSFREKLQPTPSPTPKKKGFRLFGLPKSDNF